MYIVNYLNYLLTLFLLICYNVSVTNYGSVGNSLYKNIMGVFRNECVYDVKNINVYQLLKRGDVIINKN